MLELSIFKNIISIVWFQEKLTKQIPKINDT
jgi:hypothetical protein